MIAEPRNQDLLPPEAGRRPRRVLIAGAALALAGLLAWALAGLFSAQRVVDASSLRMAAVSRGAFVADLSVNGRVVAAVSPTLYAPAAGTVTLRVRAGETVQAGQALAELDSPDLRNELSRETANLAGQQAALGRTRIEVRTRQAERRQAVDLASVGLEAAERELQRAGEAHRMGVYPRREVDRAADERASARVRLAHALQEEALAGEGQRFELQTRELDLRRQQLVVDNLQRRVESLVVRAPVAGMIGTLAVQQKAVVPADAALLSVVDLSALEVEIRIPETYADSLALGMPAEVRLGAAIHAGRLTALSPEVSDNQVTGRIAFDTAPPAELRQNQRLSVRMILDRRDGVLQLPRGSFVETGGGRSAWVLQDGIATRRALRLGAIAIDRVEVLDGLAEGDTVVIAGDQDFGDAAAIAVRP